MASRSFFQSSGFKIIIFVVGTIILGAFFSPLLFWGGKFLVSQETLKDGWLDSIHGSMERAQFSRYFNRAILLGALLMLWPTLKWMSGGEKRKITIMERFELEPNPRWWVHLLIGFVAAGGLLLLLGWIYIKMDLYQLRPATKSIGSILLGALGTGIAVALMEEFVFRGALHAVMGKIFKPKMLFVGIAVFFALVHFLKPPHPLVIDEVTLGTGFWMLGQIFSQFGDLYFLAAEFAVLFAIGLVLGYTRMKTASLWLGIGLHAGWVFGVKVLSPLTLRNFEMADKMPWLGGNLRVGLISCLTVCLTGFLLWLWLRRIPRNAFAEAE